MECRILLRVADEEAKDLMMKGSLAEFHNIDRRVGPSLRFVGFPLPGHEAAATGQQLGSLC